MRRLAIAEQEILLFFFLAENELRWFEYALSKHFGTCLSISEHVWTSYIIQEHVRASLNNMLSSHSIQELHLSTKTGHDKKIIRHWKWLAEQHLRKSVQVIRHPLTEPERNAGQECRRWETQEHPATKHCRADNCSISFRARQGASRFAVAGAWPLVPDLRTSISSLLQTDLGTV